MHIDDTYDVKIVRLNNEGLGVALVDKFVTFVSFIIHRSVTFAEN